MEYVVSTVGIVGAGQMGSGIAQLFAQNNYKVVLYDLNLGIVNKAKDRIGMALQKLVNKGKLTAGHLESVLSNIVPIDNLNEMVVADLVIEAVSEKEEIKRDILCKLGEILRSETVIASNTSSISITTLSTVTANPDRVVGMHFMNPAPLMNGVEIIKGLLTSQDVVNLAANIVEKMGKTPIFTKDSPGFIVNRILFPMLNEAMFVLYECVSGADAIDSGMKCCCNFPMGPLALADMIGLDTVLAILDTLYDEFGDPKYRACPLLKAYVAAGWLGRKTGKGFFEYK